MMDIYYGGNDILYFLKDKSHTEYLPVDLPFRPTGHWSGGGVHMPPTQYPYRQFVSLVHIAPTRWLLLGEETVRLWHLVLESPTAPKKNEGLEGGE